MQKLVITLLITLTNLESFSNAQQPCYKTSQVTPYYCNGQYWSFYECKGETTFSCYGSYPNYVMSCVCLESSPSSSSSSSSFGFISIVVTVAIGVVITLVSCFFCSFCPGYKYRVSRRRAELENSAATAPLLVPVAEDISKA